MENEKGRLIEALEILAKEKKMLVTSREYKLAKKILAIKYNIKHFNIIALGRNVKKNIKNRWISSRRKKYETKAKIIENKEFGFVSDKKIVVYTCITGGYDAPIKPLFCSNNVQYVLFSNSIDNAEGWIVKPIPDEIQKLNNNILINRYIKFHPHELFKDYEYSIYLDGNIRAMSDLSGFINAINSEVGMAMFKHHTRNCIYIEEKVLNIYKKGNKEKLHIQTEIYKKEGFPENYGMLEGNVIVVDLNNFKSLEILTKWWDEFLKTGSLRDQMSLPYVLWKLNYKIEEIGTLGNDVYSCPKFEFIQHLK